MQLEKKVEVRYSSRFFKYKDWDKIETKNKDYQL